MLHGIFQPLLFLDILGVFLDWLFGCHILSHNVEGISVDLRFSSSKELSSIFQALALCGDSIKLDRGVQFGVSD